MFRSGVRPVWEDPKNAGGLRIFCTYPFAAAGDDDAAFAWGKWIELCAAVAAGGQEWDEVNGEELAVRDRTYHVGVWTARAREGMRERLSDQLCALLGFSGQVVTGENK